MRAGQELGYFTGSIHAFHVFASAGLLTSKARQLLDDCELLLHSVPRSDPQDPDLQARVDEVRVKFKALVSAMGAFAHFYPRDDRAAADF